MAGGLHARVLEELGAGIVSGRHPAGTVMQADPLMREFGVSRSVIREAVRVLQSLGMVETVKRLGIRVLPLARWSLYDPLLIRWRLAQPSQGIQLRSLTELRSAIEPAAAELAAETAPDEVRTALTELAEEMRAVGRAGDLDTFLALDIRFHSLVLHASGNEMFAQLDAAVAEVLTGRTHYGLMPTHPHEEALQLHVDVAQAIAARRPADAHSAMDRIMRRTATEVESIWDGQPRLHL